MGVSIDWCITHVHNHKLQGHVNLHLLPVQSFEKQLETLAAFQNRHRKFVVIGFIFFLVNRDDAV